MGNQVPMGTGMMKIIYDETIGDQANRKPEKRTTTNRTQRGEALLFDTVE